MSDVQKCSSRSFVQPKNVKLCDRETRRGIRASVRALSVDPKPTMLLVPRRALQPGDPAPETRAGGRLPSRSSRRPRTKDDRAGEFESLDMLKLYKEKYNEMWREVYQLRFATPEELRRIRQNRGRHCNKQGVQTSEQGGAASRSARRL